MVEVLWLMWAKEKWLGGDVHVAHEGIRRANRSSQRQSSSRRKMVNLVRHGEPLVRMRTVADTERGIPIFLSLSANTETHFVVLPFS